MPRHRLVRPLTPLAAALTIALGAGSVAASGLAPRIDLPDGWAPEGITDGGGTTAFVGSLADGAIAEVDVRTGAVSLLASGATGRVTVGLDHDRRTDRIWAAGGPTGQVRAYDASSGALLETYAFTAGFLNDVVVTAHAVYVTDSMVQQLIVIPLPHDGSLPEPGDAYALPLTGELVYAAGFNANGIVASGPWLLLVQSNAGLLFRVDPATGTTTAVDLDGASLTFGDGLELRGSTLYVVRNQLGEVAVVRLAGDRASGELMATLTPDGVDVPTTGALVAGRLWLVNARFGTAVTPTTDYWLTQVRP
jgi:hypothetical protein